MCCCDQTSQSNTIEPIRGMTVDPTKAAGTSEYRGKSYYFCSAGCKEKFDRAPGQYAKAEVLTVASPAHNSSQAIDPVCGMPVHPSTATAHVEHEGSTYYFCCQGCAEKFRANPGKYLGPKATPAPAAKTEQQAEYVCPMHPEVRQMGPGNCSKCGMALEPVTVTAPASRTEYTCPMHPEIIRSEPGACPICGMALEPRQVTAEESNPELADMTRRFWISVALALPLLALMVSELLPSMSLQRWLSPRTWAWIEFALATPAVLWCGWPFFVRGWQSLVHRSLNMFTLISLGTGAAYLYSVIATLVPQIFPASFRGEGGQIDL